jgi:hypothetical protein
VGEPKEEELLALFEKHKQQFPSPESPEPGFRQPYRAKFQYFKADLDELITAEMKNVPEDEVRDYYEKNKDKEFRKLNLSPLDKGDDKSKSENAAEKGEATKDGDAANAKEGEDKPTDDAKAEQKNEQKVDNTDAGDTKPQADPESSEKKAQGATKTKGDSTKKADDSKQDSTEKKSPEAGDAKDQSAKTQSPNPFRLVNFQDQKVNEKPEKTDRATTKKADQEADKAVKAQPQTSAPTDKPATDSAKSDEKSPDEKKEQSDTKNQDTETTAKEAESKGETTQGDPAKESASKSPKPEPVEYRPLEQVQDEIRRTLARDRVQKQVDERLDKLREEMNSYARVMASHRRAAAKNPNEPKPKPFPFEALAEKYGVQAFTTEFVSQLDAQTNDKLEIAKSRDMSSRSPTFFLLWTQIALQPKGLLRPITTRDVATDASFLSWKIDEREGNVPEFKAVRNQVVDAWKRIKARDLAMRKAKEYAEMVRKARQPMKEVFAKEMNLPVSEAGPFSWLTRPSVPFGMQQMPPSHHPQIPGVVTPGEEFMETTFGLQPGEVAAALNHPKSIAYVIYAVKFEPSDTVLEQEFMVKIREYDRYRDAGRIKLSQAHNDWMDSLLAEYNVEWQRPPALRLAAAE